MGNPIMYPPNPTWKVVWGKDTYQASSAYEVLMAIGQRSYAPLDHKYPKRGIAYRVFVQYRILIDDELGDEEFLYRLAEFGLIRLTITGELPDDLLQQALDFSQAWYGDPKSDEEVK